MFKILKPIILLSFLTGVLILPCLVFASNGVNNNQSSSNGSALERLENVGPSGGYAQDASVWGVAGQIVNAALTFLGIIFIILIILGGFKWMTAQGNEDQAKQGSDIIRRAIIGLIIVVSAWAIWNFVSGFLL